MRVCAAILWVLSILMVNKNAYANYWGATAALDITPPVGVPLAGYGSGDRRNKKIFDWTRAHEYANMLTPSDGIIDPIRAKVFMLKKNSDILLFVGLDVIGVDWRVVNDIAERVAPLGIKREHVIVGATHTHSGPGALAKNVAMQIIAVDSFNREVYEGLVNNIVRTVYKAYARLAPVTLHTFSFDTHEVIKNRRVRSRAIDPEAKVVMMKDDSGHFLGGIFNLAIHGTSYGESNLKYSADISGWLERLLEGEIVKRYGVGRYEPTMIHWNGALGDIAPRHGRPHNMELVATRFKNQFFNHIHKLKALTGGFKVVKVKIRLGQAWINLAACGASPKGMQKLFRFFNVYMGYAFPRQTFLSFIRLGDLSMMTWPGEANASLGVKLKKMAKDLGHPEPWVLGLTNDHLFYFTTKDEFLEGGYEACLSLYNYKGGEKILKAYGQILKNYE